MQLVVNLWILPLLDNVFWIHLAEISEIELFFFLKILHVAKKINTFLLKQDVYGTIRPVLSVKVRVINTLIRCFAFFLVFLHFSVLVPEERPYIWKFSFFSDLLSVLSLSSSKLTFSLGFSVMKSRFFVFLIYNLPYLLTC